MAQGRRGQLLLRPLSREIVRVFPAAYDLRILNCWRRDLIEDDSDDEGPPGTYDSNIRSKGPPDGRPASGVPASGEPCIPSDTKRTLTRIST